MADISGDEELARRLQEEELRGHSHAQPPERPPRPHTRSSAFSLQLSQQDLAIPQRVVQTSQNVSRYFPLWLSWAMVEMAISTIVLSVTWTEECDVPLLRPWLAAYSGRFVVLIPLEIRKQRLRRAGLVSDERLRETVNFICTIWFIVGNSLLYKSSACSGGLYVWSVVLVAMTWTQILTPVILLLCLPCIVLLSRRLRPPPGATAASIATLPTRKYHEPAGNADGASADTQTSCAVCMEQLKEGDDLRVLPCTHYFHPQCIDPWLLTKDICPLCRAQLPRHTSRWAAIRYACGCVGGAPCQCWPGWCCGNARRRRDSHGSAYASLPNQDHDHPGSHLPPSPLGAAGVELSARVDPDIIDLERGGASQPPLPPRSIQ